MELLYGEENDRMRKSAGEQRRTSAERVFVEEDKSQLLIPEENTPSLKYEVANE